jgi:hypothetical protein
MRRLALFLLGALLATALAASPARAAFGLTDFEVAIQDEDGGAATQAGSHPFAMTTSFGIAHTGEKGNAIADGKIRDVILEQMAGLTGDTTAVPRCSTADFLIDRAGAPTCPVETVVGIQSSSYLSTDFDTTPGPVFNLFPPPGVPVRIGWKVEGIPVVVDIGIKPAPEYNAIAATRGINQTLSVFSAAIELWGVPGDPAHDIVRGHDCVRENAEVIEHKRFLRDQSGKRCPSASGPLPFLTLPRNCAGEATTRYEARSWQEPEHWVTGSHTGAALTGCGKLEFLPAISSRATADTAGTGTGLDFELDFEDEVDHRGEGLLELGGIAQSDMKKIAVTLPEGVTANPSLAEGLGVCTPADLDRETLAAEAGEGCPNSSKIGTVQVQTPLVEDPIEGAVFLAQQDDPATAAKGAENPFDSLLAMHVVFKDRKLGVLVKQAGRVEPDPQTGQLRTIFGEAGQEIAQFPFTRLKFHFREGQRAPLITPQACGAYETKAEIVPWARPNEAITTTASFQITRGVGGGPCPTGGLPPFKPSLLAGTINNRAGGFSPFNIRLSRTDSEQEITHFSIKLPPGVVGKLAGIPFCSEGAIAVAESREHPGGGRAELASPSCPAASAIGRSLVGSGVGSALTYAPGKVYLAGPYNGSAISIVAITAGVVGPFDIGTVVVREALKVNPETGEVFIDATGSDPIPHIIQGIPVHLRDIRVYTDRPQFVLNPTNCTRTSTASTLLGAGLDFASVADDNPITVSTPFQAADCAALPFRPRLSFKLVGGTKRGAHPSLRAHLKMNGIGEAGIAHAQVTLPRSEFIENAHFNTICTRIQFKAGPGNGELCPAGSVYGHAKAVTPILDEPLVGPVFLRSSEHKLPDVVASLHSGKIDVHLVGRVDSVKGQLRNTFEVVPDAPVSTFDLTLLGGKKGLFVNSTNLCKGRHRALAEFIGQNGKQLSSRPELKAKCPKARKGKQGSAKRPRPKR